MTKESTFFRKLLFGTVRRKLVLAFSLIIFLVITLSVSTFYLNEQLRTLTLEIKDIDAPMDIMLEQIIGYDAMLTEDAHSALLHAEAGEYELAKEHKENYDKISSKLDHLLKVDYLFLMEKSSMSKETKIKENFILNNLDKINVQLTTLEINAFDAIERNDLNSAYEFIVGEDYDSLKDKLAESYLELTTTQRSSTNALRIEITTQTRNIENLILIFSVIVIILGLLIMYVISNNISAPIKELDIAVKEVAKGNFEKRVNIHRDDELTELGDEFNKMAAALGSTEEKRKQIDKVKTEFLSITSHELRSPMTPMRAQLQMLLEGYFGKLNPKQKEAAGIILRNTERLDKILQDFLEISRIEAARLKFSFIKTTLTPHIKHVVEELNAFMPEKHVSIELKMTQLPEMEVDPDRVMQVLRNLVNNAVKFVPDTGGKILITVQPKEDHLLFMVKDNGVGIADENKNRIFEPFFQEEQSMYRKYQGTGLGLAICKGIIESQKGRIWFESSKGKGATFYFTIPYTPTKEIAPIKILFSGREMEEGQILALFKEVLGPLGEKEFTILKNQKGISSESVLNYVDIISKSNIITSDQAKEFKNKVNVVYTTDEDLKKSFVSLGNTISDEDLSMFIKGEKK